MRLAFFTVVYPAAEPFLEDYLRSLAFQNDQAFEIFLMNDGLIGIEERLSALPVSAIVHPARGTPVQIRKDGIRLAREAGIDMLIFLEADDYCVDSRVLRTRAAAGQAEILFYESLLFGDTLTEPVPLLAEHMGRGELSREVLKEANFLGLSNTAVRCESMYRVVNELPDDLVAFDWALFTAMTMEGAAFQFVPGAETHYRRHAGNVADPLDLSDAQIRRGVAVKARHYALFGSDGAPYDRLAEAFAELSARLDGDAVFRYDYFRAVRENAPPVPLWWEPMRLAEELGL